MSQKGNSSKDDPAIKAAKINRSGPIIASIITGIFAIVVVATQKDYLSSLFIVKEGCFSEEDVTLAIKEPVTIGESFSVSAEVKNYSTLPHYYRWEARLGSFERLEQSAANTNIYQAPKRPVDETVIVFISTKDNACKSVEKRVGIKVLPKEVNPKISGIIDFSPSLSNSPLELPSQGGPPLAVSPVKFVKKYFSYLQQGIDDYKEFKKKGDKSIASTSRENFELAYRMLSKRFLKDQEIEPLEKYVKFWQRCGLKYKDESIYLKHGGISEGKATVVVDFLFPSRLEGCGSPKTSVKLGLVMDSPSESWLIDISE